jgi:hypothetical protein
MENPQAPLYYVNERDGNFVVVSDSDNVVLVCQDEASASNYAVLLTEAYQRGYKAGYRNAMKASRSNRFNSR